MDELNQGQNDTQQVGATSPQQQTVEDTPVSKVEEEVVRTDESRSQKNGSYWYSKRQMDKFSKELSEVKEYLSNLNTVLTQYQNPVQKSDSSSAQVDYWTDPDKAVESKVNSLMDHKLTQLQLEQSKNYANQLIHSQDDVETEDDIKEIRGVIDKYHLNNILEVDPDVAVELALDRWRNERDATDQEENKETIKPSKVQAGGVRSSSPTIAGKKIWTRDEIRQIMYDPKKYSQFADDIQTAQKEGRIK